MSRIIHWVAVLQFSFKCLFGLALMAVLFAASGCGKRHNWWEHYRPESKDPYGTWLISNLLKDYFPGQEYSVISDSLIADLNSSDTLTNYVFVGSWFSLADAELEALMKFVDRGNYAFIASQQMPLFLFDSLGKYECADFSRFADSLSYENFVSDTSIALNFVHPELRKADGYSYKFWEWQQTSFYAWDYLPAELFCEAQTVFAALGTLQNDSFINFARADYGNGAFYLHTTPIAFTNYHLIGQEGLEYAAKVFSHLPKGPVLWDDYQKRVGNFFPRNQRNFSESPLKYILSQPPLAWAWYILLGMAVFYLIFRAKRRQRIIPVLEQNVNTSLEFIATIGRLYFFQNNHKQLALQKMKFFLSFVRERYHLPTKDLDNQFAAQLVAVSEVPQELLGKILILHRNIAKSGFVSENTLVDFHRLMEQFYSQCK